MLRKRINFHGLQSKTDELGFEPKSSVPESQIVGDLF